MARIDKQVARDLMLTGLNDTDIAKRFGTSRQAVNLVRKRLVEDGSLPSKGTDEIQGTKAIRPTPGGDTLLRQIAPQISDDSPTPPMTAPSYQEITAWMVNIINQASESRILRRKLDDAEKASSNLQEEIQQLRKELKQARIQQERNAARASKYDEAVKRLENTEREITSKATTQ